MTLKRTTLVSIGDKADFDSFKRLHKERKSFKNSHINYCALSYKNLLNNKTPDIKTEEVVFFLFFPFDHWNKNIETRYYRGIYGNLQFYKKFIHFFNRVEASIRRNFRGKKIHFINSPLLASMYRDKLKVKESLSRRGISTPRTHKIKSHRNIYSCVKKNRSLFLKVRYGSMGKGLTYIGPDKWKTNFLFRRGRILSRKSDYGWHFRSIVKKEAFLKNLLKESIYTEDAIDSFHVRGRKFDLRAYVFFGKVLFIYPRTSDPENITTNISQEGQGEYPAFLRSIPNSVVGKVRKTAARAVKALGLNFAGVDVLIDKKLKRIYVVDINLFPGFPNKKIFNLAKHIVTELKSRARSRYL